VKLGSFVTHTRLQHFSILLIALTIVSACSQPIPFNSPVPTITERHKAQFTLDKTEAAEGEVVTAKWFISGQAQKIKIQSASDTLLRFSWSPDDPNSTMMTFTVPISLAGVSPIYFLLDVDGRTIASTALMIRCEHPWFFIPRPPECPYEPVKLRATVFQTFEHGLTIHLEGTNLTFLLRDDGQGNGTVLDSVEGLDQLGNATSEKRLYNACYSYSSGSDSQVRYINDPEGRILKMRGYDLLDHWSVVEQIGNTPVKFVGCSR
jgi:hypothetical protein